MRGKARDPSILLSIWLMYRDMRCAIEYYPRKRLNVRDDCKSEWQPVRQFAKKGLTYMFLLREKAREMLQNHPWCEYTWHNVIELRRFLANFLHTTCMLAQPFCKSFLRLFPSYERKPSVHCQSLVNGVISNNYINAIYVEIIICDVFIIIKFIFIIIIKLLKKFDINNTWYSTFSFYEEIFRFIIR